MKEMDCQLVFPRFLEYSDELSALRMKGNYMNNLVEACSFRRTETSRETASEKQIERVSERSE